MLIYTTTYLVMCTYNDFCFIPMQPSYVLEVSGIKEFYVYDNIHHLLV